jgi:hypothetical protein
MYLAAAMTGRRQSLTLRLPVFPVAHPPYSTVAPPSTA